MDQRCEGVNTMPDESGLKNKTAFISDMDGVIYHGNNLLPGAADFVRLLEERGLRYLFLTNSSERTPRELAEKLARLGVRVSPEHFYTSALATADFLSRQRPGCTVFSCFQLTAGLSRCANLAQRFLFLANRRQQYRAVLL